MSEVAVSAPVAAPVNGAEQVGIPSNNGSAEIQPKMYKLKIDGQEREYPEAEIIKRAQLAEAAEKRFEESARKERDMTALLKAFEQDPYGVLKALGKDPRQLSENYLKGVYEVEQMPEADRRAHQLEQDLKREQSERQKLEQSIEEQRQASANQEIRQNLHQTIIGAMEKSALPKNERTVGRMSYYMEHAIANDIPYTMDDIVDRTMKDLDNDSKSFITSRSEDDIIAMLPKNVIDKILKGTINKISPPRIAPARAKPQAGQKPNPRGNVSDLARRVGLI